MSHLRQPTERQETTIRKNTGGTPLSVTAENRPSQRSFYPHRLAGVCQGKGGDRLSAGYPLPINGID